MTNSTSLICRFIFSLITREVSYTKYCFNLFWEGLFFSVCTVMCVFLNQEVGLYCSCCVLITNKLTSCRPLWTFPHFSTLISTFLSHKNKFFFGIFSFQGGHYSLKAHNLLGPDGIVWFSWKDSDFYSLKAVTMMIRPRSFRPRLSP